MSNFQTEKTPRKNFAPAAFGLALLGSAAGWLGYNIKKDPISPDTGLPSSVQQNLNLISKVDDSGELINGAWIAKSPEDQPFIDSTRHVYSITKSNAPLGGRARLILSSTITEMLDGLSTDKYTNYFSSDAEKKILITTLDKFNQSLSLNSNIDKIIKLPISKSDRIAIINITDKFSHKLKITDPVELRAAYLDSQQELNQAVYFGMPDIEN